MRNDSSTPLLSCNSLSVLLKLSSASSIALLVFHFPKPLFYGSMVMLCPKCPWYFLKLTFFPVCRQSLLIYIHSAVDMEGAQVINGKATLGNAVPVAKQIIVCVSPSQSFFPNKHVLVCTNQTQLYSVTITE